MDRHNSGQHKLTQLGPAQAALGDYGTAVKHVNGAVKMLEIRNEKPKVGLEDTLEHMLHAFVHDNGLLEVDHSGGAMHRGGFSANHVTYVGLLSNMDERNVLL